MKLVTCGLQTVSPFSEFKTIQAADATGALKNGSTASDLTKLLVASMWLGLCLPVHACFSLRFRGMLDLQPFLYLDAFLFSAIERANCNCFLL